MINAKTDIIVAAAKRALEHQVKSILLLESTLGDSFAHVVGMLLSTSNVVTTGIGKSGIVAKKFAATLASAGVSSRYIHPVDALHGDAGVIRSGDVIVAISKSGETPELQRFIAAVRGIGVQVVVITSRVASALAEVADVTLLAPITHEMDANNIVPTTSSTAALVLTDLLSVSVLSLQTHPLKHLELSHPSGMIGGTLLKSVADVMHTGTAFPRVDPGSSMLEVLAELSSKALGIVCVCEGQKLIGVLTDGDIRRLVAQRVDLGNSRVRDVMTAAPVTIDKTSSLHAALRLMEDRERQISALPVLDDEACVGIVRIHDIVRLQL